MNFYEWLMNHYGEYSYEIHDLANEIMKDNDFPKDGKVTDIASYFNKFRVGYRVLPVVAAAIFEYILYIGENEMEVI